MVMHLFHINFANVNGEKSSLFNKTPITTDGINKTNYYKSTTFGKIIQSLHVQIYLKKNNSEIVTVFQ